MPQLSIAGAGAAPARPPCGLRHARRQRLAAQAALPAVRRPAAPLGAPARAPMRSARRTSPLTAAAGAAAAALAAPGGALAPAAGAVCAEGWPLWAALAACAALSQLAERRTALGAALSAPLVSMLLAMAAAAGGLLPTGAAADGAYAPVWRFLMPLAASLFLLEADFSKCVGLLGLSGAAAKGEREGRSCLPRRPPP